jgi:very-short-patch-repair endonuclease
MTEPEIMLWSRLRKPTSDQPKFRRQQPIGSVIVDFYCPGARLAIEVDGATHWGDHSRARDEARDQWLAAQGIRVMRIPASAIYRDCAAAADGVLRRAEALIAQERSAGGSPPPPPALRRTVPLPRFAGEERK